MCPSFINSWLHLEQKENLSSTKQAIFTIHCFNCATSALTLSMLNRFPVYLLTLSDTPATHGMLTLPHLFFFSSTSVCEVFVLIWAQRHSEAGGGGWKSQTQTEQGGVRSWMHGVQTDYTSQKQNKCGSASRSGEHGPSAAERQATPRDVHFPARQDRWFTGCVMSQ